MKTFVGLLRGVNLAGKRLVAMAELRDLVAGLGFARVRTLLQSGNVVFDAPAAPAEKLELRLQEAIVRRFGHEVDVFVRDLPAWDALIDGNPYHAEAKSDPSHLLAMCLKRAPGAGANERLSAAIVGRERGVVAGTLAYLVYPDGVGTSKLTAAKIERALGSSGTARNWNTVLKLRELANS